MQACNTYRHFVLHSGALFTFSVMFYKTNCAAVFLPAFWISSCVNLHSLLLLLATTAGAHNLAACLVSELELNTY